MTTYIDLTIRPASYDHASRALDSVGCWLERLRGDTYVVACSGRHAHEAATMREIAEEALESHRVMVYPD